MFTSIITTADVFEEDYTENGIIVFKAGDVKPWQTVVAVGDAIRNIKVGDKVMINLDHYVKKQYEENSVRKELMENKKVGYIFNYVAMDDENGNPKEYFLFNDRDILYIFEGEEKEDTAPATESVKNIILPLNSATIGKGHCPNVKIESVAPFF